MSTLIPILVTLIIFAFLMRETPKPPEVETKQDLLNDGYSAKEAREELRKQRAEHRDHTRLKNDAMRTGAAVGRLAKRATRISRKWKL